MNLDTAFDTPQRLCPMPAGPTLLNGSCWTVRLPQGDAAIEAPRKLLERVAMACDGIQSVAEIVAGTRPEALRRQVAALIDDLMKAGVLVDVGLFPVAAQRFGWRPGPFGNSAQTAQWLQVPNRFPVADAKSAQPGPGLSTPIDALLDKRRSVRTFDDRPVNEQALLAHLWLLGGVVDSRARAHIGPRRTVPSAGAAYAVRPMLVLRRAVGPWNPGVYSVDYPAPRRVRLSLVSTDAAWLPRAVIDPWYLSFATGMVFLVANPRFVASRYRARALQLVLIEAGAALQNAALAADDQGLAMSPYDGYVETVAIASLKLSAHEMIAAALVFGAKPTEDQIRLNEESSIGIEFDWFDTSSARYAVPHHVARCNLVGDDGVEIDSWGCDPDPQLAWRKAVVEVLERRSYRSPKDVHLGRFIDWDHALDPRSVVRYAESQYRDPAFKLKPFDEQALCGWVAGRQLASGKTVQVLAEQVYSTSVLRAAAPAACYGYTVTNSSGCAAHVDAGLALEAALLELTERDAFMRSWLMQKPGVGLSVRSLPLELRRRVQALEAAGCRVSVQQLPSPWAAVCVMYAQSEAAHFTVAGAGARLALAQAVEAALDEVEPQVFAKLNEPKPDGVAPASVLLPGDHGRLYATARYFRRADALLQPSQSVSFAKACRHEYGAEPVSKRLLGAGCDVVVVDMTAPHSTIDQGRTPVVALRALVPCLIPISFGYRREPLGSLPSYDRRARFPHPFP